MLDAALHDARIAPRASAASLVTAFVVHACDRDTQLVSIPRPEIHVVVRFGSSARRGLDAHVLGARRRVHRKSVHGGQRALMARLRLGASQAVLGVPASAVAGRIAALDELWGDDATQRLLERLAGARGLADAAAILERAIGERIARAPAREPSPLVLDAAARLATTSVHAVAVELGLSERHLRRVFRDAVGVSPKAFAKLTRFRRALRAARADRHPSWAGIAAAAGYYDQAHLIDEFRDIAGVTPRALLGELEAGAGAPR